MSTESRLLELTTLYEISKVVNSTLELDEILQETVRIVRERMRVDVCNIYLVEKRRLVLRARSEPDDVRTGLPAGEVVLRLGEGLSGWAAEHGQPIAAGRAVDDPRASQVADLRDQEYVSLLAAPLLSRGATIGVMNVQTREERAFSEVDMQFLCSVASLISGAIRNTQVHMKAIRGLHELITLNEAGKIINSTLDLDELLARVCEIANNILWSDGCLLRLLNPSNGHLDLVALHRTRETDGDEVIALEQQAAEQVVVEGYPSLRNPDDTRTDGRTLHDKLSMITVPIMAKGEPRGTISVYTLGRQEGPFSVSDRRLLVTLASQSGIAIDNARLFEQQTEAKRKLRETQQQLIRHEKLAALGHMAAGVAHELRNPLACIGGFAMRIAKHLDKPEVIQDYVGVITSEVRRLESLVRDILHYAQPTPSTLGPVDLREVLSAVRELLNIDESETYTMTVDIHEALAVVHGDRNQLLRVFLNLAQNGFDAMQRGGEVHIKADLCLGQRDQVAIEVRDHGDGISLDQLDRVFDPFFTTKADGTGLGLAIVKSLLEAMNGSIAAGSRPGQGTTFTIVLPLAGKQTPSS